MMEIRLILSSKNLKKRRDFGGCVLKTQHQIHLSKKYLIFAEKRVHVNNSDGEAKFTVEPLNLIENIGLKPKDIRYAEAIIEENKDIIIQRWNEFFKNK